MSSYRFGDVVEIANVSRNSLKRWTQIGLIAPQGTGDPEATWRKFTFRNLIEARICHALRRVNVAEELLFSVVKNLNRLFDGQDMIVTADGIAKPFRDVTEYFLWITKTVFVIEDSDVEHDTFTMQFCDLAKLTEIHRSGGDAFGSYDAGIVIYLSALIADLETRTGDVFDLQTYARRIAEETIAKLEKGEKP